MIPSKKILSTKINLATYNSVVDYTIINAKQGNRKFITASAVHLIMESHDQPSVRKALDKANIITPDGVPLVWSLNLLGAKNQRRVYGPELMLRICLAASHEGIPVGLYGGMANHMNALKNNLYKNSQHLKINYANSPPFRLPTKEEEQKTIEEINKSGVKILFVGLGCPKQELWCSNNLGKIDAVLVSVGAAFDFHSGRVKQAPSWVQTIGMEWVFRLIMEPSRLWKRYLKHNPRFLVLVAKQILLYKLNTVKSHHEPK